MDKNQFPYQDAFIKYLHKRGLAPISIYEYSLYVKDMFNYLSNFNWGYQRDHRVSQLLDRDIADYLNMLITKRGFVESTYDKILSHINVYFKFLFQNGWNQHLPTIGLSGQKRRVPKQMSSEWLNQMPELLQNTELNFYTRLTLLLISHGYSEKEFLQPDFYKELANEKWQPFEKTFIADFQTFIHPIQKRQHSADIFLKQRLNGDPHITLPGLHKYLRPDQEITNFKLSPARLLQSYMINFIKNHGDLSINELAHQLRITPASILYYQGLIYHA